MVLASGNPFYLTFSCFFRQIYLEFAHETSTRILRQEWTAAWHSLLWIHQCSDLEVVLVGSRGKDLPLLGSLFPFCLIFKVQLHASCSWGISLMEHLVTTPPFPESPQPILALVFGFLYTLDYLTTEHYFLEYFWGNFFILKQIFLLEFHL